MFLVKKLKVRKNRSYFGRRYESDMGKTNRWNEKKYANENRIEDVSH